MPALRSLFLICWLYSYLVGATRAGEPLLLVGQPPVNATFHSATEAGLFQFEIAGQTQQVTAQQLIRWSTPDRNDRGSELLLSDGSRLKLAESWTGKQPWQIDGDSLAATTKLFGEIAIPRTKLQAIVLRPPSESQKRTGFFDRLRTTPNSADQIWLTNGDQLTGTFLGLQIQAKQQAVTFQVRASTQPLQILPSRIAAITFADCEKVSREPKLAVGLRDGSSLQADSLVADNTQLGVVLANRVMLSGAKAFGVTYLRSFRVSCGYLSDLKPVDYRHVPYLKIIWPYKLDRNVLAGPLHSSGRNYPKGIGTMTASRLTYDLAVPKLKVFSRFVATVAIDDIAEGGGSAIFRVYLQQQGQPWQLAYSSPIVRGGDSPVPVEVQLGDASGLMLVTDYADRGDQRDYANWLDARFE